MSSHHPIPIDMLDTHLAVLGTSGYGKSNAIKGAVEQLLDTQARVVIVDPTGVWWGLRLTRDGKKPSPYPLVIFGGRHADLPLDGGAGERVAQVLGSSTTPAILDTQQMSVAARTRFFIDFAEAILRENRGPLHLILDEAHLFAPQSGGSGLIPALLHATNNLVALGRSAGLRIVLITQRAAKLHKDALSQATGLVVMGLIDPRDQKAARGWLDGAPDQSRSKEIMASLASLPVGTGWIYAPRIGVLEKVAFPLVGTFDSGKPEANADAPALKPLDVAALREAMSVSSTANVGEKMDIAGKADSRKQPVASAAGTTRANEASLAAAERRGYERGLAEGRADGLGDRAVWARRSAEAMKAALEKAIGAVDIRTVLNADAALWQEIMPDVPIQTREGDPAPQGMVAARPAKPTVEYSEISPRKQRQPAPHPKPNGATHPARTGPQRELLRALAWWHCMGQREPTRTQVAAIAGWKPKGSNLRNRLSELSAAGLVEYPRTGIVRLTKAGLDEAPEPDLAKTLVDSVREVLTGPQSTIFEEMLKWGKPIDRAVLAQAIGWEPAGSNLRNRLSEMSALELVEYPGRGVVALQGWVQ